MDFSISEGLHNVCMNDSGITITWQIFVPWRKSCSITDALEVMQRGRIASVVKLDENNTLAIVADPSNDGYAVMISNKNGVTEARHTFMGRSAFEKFYHTLGPSDQSAKKFLETLEVLK